jgi:CRP/FNR family transcriptional regulator, polysaccharide utilization system transcription regulator
MQYRNPYIELCIEGPSSIFKGLSQSEKESIEMHHSVALFRKSETIIREGGKPKGLYCIVSGKAKISKTGVGGREQILRMLRPESFISYRSLYSDSHFPFNVTAVESSAVVIFEKQCMSGIIKHNAELGLRFIKVLTEELTFSNNRIISLTQKHVRGRVAESLLILRDAYGTEADGRTLRVLLSREDIAHMSNMTTSNAIRILSDFASESLIELEGRKIMIIDEENLQTVSESGE